jgi:hypothetical protein
MQLPVITDNMHRMELSIKGNKKKALSFERGGGREEVKFKGGKAVVGDGLPADSCKPNIFLLFYHFYCEIGPNTVTFEKFFSVF